MCTFTVAGEDGGSGSVNEAAYFKCEYRDGDGVTAHCSNQYDSGGVVEGSLGAFWHPCALGTDCADCGERCGQAEQAAAAPSGLAAFPRISFYPSALSLTTGQVRKTVVRIDTPVGAGYDAFPYLSIGLASTHPNITISPSHVMWNRGSNVTVGRAFTISVDGSTPVGALANPFALAVVSSESYYTGFAPTFAMATLATPSPPAPPPALPPVGTGCTATNAALNRLTYDECRLEYTSRGFANFVAFESPDGFLNTSNPNIADYWGLNGICYLNTETMVFYYRQYSWINQCNPYACYCDVSSPPPPPPGQCGTDFCGCANPDGEGGYAICPGSGGCANHPNRCMTHWGSVCVANRRRNGVCSVPSPPSTPPS